MLLGPCIKYHQGMNVNIPVLNPAHQARSRRIKEVPNGSQSMIWAHLGIVGIRLILQLSTELSTEFYSCHGSSTWPSNSFELIRTHVNQVGSLERHRHELRLAQCDLLRFHFHHFHSLEACLTLLTLLTIPSVGHSTAVPLCPMASSPRPSHFDGHHLQWAREDCDPRKESPEHQLQGRAHHVQLSPREGSKCFQLGGYWFGQGDLRPPEFVQSKITEGIQTHAQYIYMCSIDTLIQHTYTYIQLCNIRIIYIHVFIFQTLEDSTWYIHVYTLYVLCISFRIIPDFKFRACRTCTQVKCGDSSDTSKYTWLQACMIVRAWRKP